MSSILKAVPLLVIAIVALGCRAEQSNRATGSRGTGVAAVDRPADAALEMAAGVYAIEIVNRTPHSLTVYFDAPDGAVELGSVPGAGAAEFALSGPPALEVDLRAESEGSQLTRHGSVTLSMSSKAVWTIEANAASP